MFRGHLLVVGFGRYSDVEAPERSKQARTLHLVVPKLVGHEARLADELFDRTVEMTASCDATLDRIEPALPLGRSFVLG